MAVNPQAPSQTTARQYTFFDLLAILCCEIRRLSQDRQGTIYRIFRSNANYTKYYKSVRQRFPFLAVGGGQSIVYYHSLTPQQASQILDALGSARSDLDWVMILAVIEAIDQLLELKENLRAFLQDKRCPVTPLSPDERGSDRVSQYYYRFDALNPATKEYGFLLPREPCQWQRTGSRSMDSVGFCPLSVMKNYLWVRPGAGYQIVNLYSDFHLSPDSRLRLVTSPLGSQTPFLLHCQPERSSFEIEYLDASTPVTNARLQNVINISVQERANIAMFPELMASPASIRDCAAYIQDHWKLNFPNLILLPTSEYDGEQGWVNELTALDADGACIFTYHKQHPFRLEKKRQGESPGGEPAGPEVFDEPIQPDQTVYLLHVPGIGRIGFLICSDVFRKGYLDFLMEELKVTLLLHIVFSPGADLLNRMLATAERNSCDVVMCNTCAAWDEVEKIPDERAPVEILDKPMVNIYYPDGHNGRKCTGPQPPPLTCTRQECTGCAFVIEVASTYGGQQIPVRHRYE